MPLIELKEKERLYENNKVYLQHTQLRVLLHELAEKDLTLEMVETINQDIVVVNDHDLTSNGLSKLLKTKQTKILKLVDKELKLVPKDYYRNLWQITGMSAIGLPIGAAIGVLVNNMGLLAVGLPIGMGIGILIGVRMDKKALEEGRQLHTEIKP